MEIDQPPANEKDDKKEEPTKADLNAINYESTWPQYYLPNLIVIIFRSQRLVCST